MIFIRDGFFHRYRKNKKFIKKYPELFTAKP